jgi:hypothetical protein
MTSRDDSLLLVSVKEAGRQFTTGRPVRFPFVRNTGPSPKFGKTYQQDIEPAGRYLLHDDTDGTHELPGGWIRGEISVRSPLVLLAQGPNDDRLYGPNSWKMRLFRHYKKKGRGLSEALRRDGFDVIVTVSNRGDTQEIVVL